MDAKFNLTAVNGSVIPYIGWVQVRVKLIAPSSHSNQGELIVPFLVTSETLDCPILGYNVIEELVSLWCLGELRDKVAIPYLDDIIVFSMSFKEHVEHRVKLKPRKCSLFKREVQFLGRVVSDDGYRMDPGCVRAVEKLKEQIPKTVGEVRQLAGILSYYRRYIKNFAKITRPIYNLSTSGKDGQSLSKTPVSWGREQQQALDELIRHLSNPPIMAYPDFSKSFTLHTDASKDGLGAVLYQNQDGVMRVSAYGSRALSPAEKNYHLHAGKLEFLALKWAVTDHFRYFFTTLQSLLSSRIITR